jgi:hypothetical protein
VTPHKSNKRGTYRLDRQFRGVGRLLRASGTTDPKLFKLLDAMLVTLYKNGRIDILQAIAGGSLTPMEVWSRYRNSELDRLPTVETMVPLDPSVYGWVKDYDCSEDHRAGLLYSFRALLKLAKKGATVADLPALLRAYKREAKATPRMFNRTRSAVQAYLHDTVGSSHPAWRAVSEVKPLKVARGEGRPLTVARARELVGAMGSERGAELWSVVTTGRGAMEYWGRWKELPDRVHIAGTKREGRIRDVPRIGRVVKPAVLYPAWRKALLLAATGERDPKVAAKHPDAVRMYDLRRTYATWMEAAGIPRTRRKLYMGHGAGDVTDLYERHQIEAFLAEDAAKLRHYLGEARGPGLRLEKAGAAG